jgi:protein O-mannosyl-transferase
MSERTFRWPAAAIAALALASSAIGIVNQFTYDDRYVIEKSPSMHTLAHWWRAFVSSYWPPAWGGDGYRPLTILAFKFEWAIGGGRPMVFHAANILLYAAAAVLMFALARRLLPDWAAWLAAACFAVHPVHVEAVANVVGQSELIVAIPLIAAISLYLRDRMRGPLQPRTAVAIVVLYAVGCFAKEHAFVLPAILAAAEFTVIDDPRPWRERVAAGRLFYLTLTLTAVGILAARSLVLANQPLGGFQPFTPFNSLHIGNRDRVLTALGVVPSWIRLLFWPVRLSSEYGPPDIEIAQGFSITQLPGFALLVAILALGWLLRRRLPVIGFGIALGCIALLPSSNFLLPAGIVLAERTLFLPSVGAMLIVGALAVLAAGHLRERFRSPARARLIGGAVAAGAIAAALGRSVQRTTVWRENDRLFRQAVLDAPRDYRAHFMLGAWNFEQKRLRDGEAEYRRALALFPYDPFLSYDLAEEYRGVGLCGPAIPMYRWTYGLDPKFPLGRGAMAWCLLNEGQYTDARNTALESIRFGGDVKAMRRLIAFTDSVAAAEGKGTGHNQVRLTGSTSKLPDSVQKARARAVNPPGN